MNNTHRALRETGERERGGERERQRACVRGREKEGVCGRERERFQVGFELAGYNCGSGGSGVTVIGPFFPEGFWDFLFIHTVDIRTFDVSFHATLRIFYIE